METCRQSQCDKPAEFLVTWRADKDCTFQCCEEHYQAILTAVQYCKVESLTGKPLKEGDLSE